MRYLCRLDGGEKNHIECDWEDESMLELKAVMVETVTGAMDPLSFTARSGEMMLLCGEHLSTLFLAIMGLQPLAGGYITMDGEPLTMSSAPYFRRYMSYLPADVDIVGDDVASLVSDMQFMRASKKTPFSKQQLFAEWQLLGMEPSLYGRSIKDLDSSLRQLLLLSMAGVLHRKVLLTDEPLRFQHDAEPVAKYLRRQAEQGTVVIVSDSSRSLLQYSDNCVDVQF